MKRTVVLLGPYPPPYGGVAIFMQRLYQLLNGVGQPTKLLTFSPAASSDEHIIHLNHSRRSFIRWAGHLITARVCFDSSTFALEYPEPRLAGRWRMIRSWRRFEWIKMIHDGSLPERFKSFGPDQRAIFETMLADIDVMVTANQSLAGWLRQEIGWTKALLIVGPLLPDDRDPKEVGLLQAVSAFLNSHHKVIVAIGVFTPAYGFHHIALALEKLRARTSLDLGLILIDGAFAGDSAYKAMVLDHRDWILDLAAVSHVQVRAILSQSDIFVRATQFESYGLSRVEALMGQIPVVATNVGETRGMLIYEYGDIDQLGQHLYSALWARSAGRAPDWSNFFRHQAEENWATLHQLLDTAASGRVQAS